MQKCARNRSALRLSASCLVITVAGLTSVASAQSSGSDAQWSSNEIIVTATKRSESIQNVPFSINAQTAEAMQRMGATSIEDVSRSVAGLTVQNLGPGQSQVSVRGVSAGQVVRDQPGVKEQVGVYLDESVISMSLFTPDFDLFDLGRVETLRGPQGTLFGSGSEGGTVRYITKQPRLGQTEGTVEGGVNLLKGGDAGYSGKAAVNLPLGETAAIRAVGYAEHYAGFIDAIGPAGGKNVNDGRRYGGRLSLLWEPAPGIKLTPRVIYQDIKTNGFNREDSYHLYYNELISPTNILPERTQYLKLREEFRDKTTLADFTGNVELGSDVALTSITTYIHRNILVSRDASALSGSVSVTPFILGLGVAPALANLPSNLRDRTKLEQWTQELRLSSTGEGPFQWVLGGFYSHVDRTYEQRLPTPGYDALVDATLGAGASAGAANGFPLNSPYNADIPYTIKQYAAFGEASYKFGQFKLTAGGRYYDFKESRDFRTGGLFANGDNRVGDKTGSNGFTPRFIASYEANRDLTFNVQASKGFRLGGVNDPLNLPLCNGGATGPDAATYGNRPTFDDETLWNYEAGVKASSGGITFNAAVFHNDIKNLQVTADAGSCSSRIIFNVPKAHTTGLEAELSARLSPNFDLSISGSYIDSKIDSNVTDAGGTVIAGIRKGNRLPTVPKFQMAAAATYTAEVGAEADWSFTASVQHVGNRYTQLADQEPGAGSFPSSIYYDPATGAYGTGAFDFGSYRLGAYNLVNLSTGISWDSGLSVTLYVNNLFDENALYSLDRERGGRGRLGYNIGTPRKMGVTVRKDF